MTTPQEIANTVVFLISSRSSHTTERGCRWTAATCTLIGRSHGAALRVAAALCQALDLVDSPALIEGISATTNASGREFARHLRISSFWFCSYLMF